MFLLLNQSIGGIYAMQKKKKKAKPTTWQQHHISYSPEIKVWVRKPEHWVITQLQRFSGLSYGAKRAIRAVLKDKPVYKRK